MDAQNLTQTVQKALDEIRPFLLADGGDISLVSIEENVESCAPETLLNSLKK